MDLHTRYCCDYEYENNMPKIDCDQPLMNQDTKIVNPYKPENINRNKLIELFDNNENDEIKKILSVTWQWFHINELLFEYCIDRNDIDFLERIISNNNDIDLFASLEGKDKFVKLLIDMDRDDMCKYILNHVQLSPEIIDEFLKYIVREQKINYLELFATHNHKMSHTHLMMAIVYNCIDVVTYAIVNGYEVQIAFDNCAFYAYYQHDISCDTLISVSMVKLLVEYQIDIFEKIGWLSLHAAKHGSLDLLKYCYMCDPVIDVTTGLVVACRNNNVHIAKYVLESGANINIVNDETLKTLLSILLNYVYIMVLNQVRIQLITYSLDFLFLKKSTNYKY